MKLPSEKEESNQTIDYISVGREHRRRYIPADDDYIDWSMISSDDE